MNLKQQFRIHRKPAVVAASGSLFAAGWAIGTFHDLPRASAALVILAALVGGYDVAKKAYYTLRSGTVGINTLVTLAAVGAIVIGEYWEAAAVVFLFALGNYLEARTMGKTRSALEELLEMTPETAIVRREGESEARSASESRAVQPRGLVEVPAREVEPGETVIVKPGSKVPVDGEVSDGESAIDQSPVTGESAPVHKTAGDEVYAGTITQEGALEVVATGTGRDTTLERIIRRVEEAQEAKAPTETIIERFARYYTPAIVVLAVGAYAITGNAVMALTLLVIGCPGALVIGPPVSIVSAIGSAARSGVLMKGGEHLETAGKIDLVAFDKTGTLTNGEPTVSHVEGFGVDERALLREAAIAEKKSEHHLADAILEAARSDDSDREALATDGGEQSNGLRSSSALRSDGGTVTDRPNDATLERATPSIPDPDEFEVVAGKGVAARHDGRRIVVGNRALLEDRDIDVPTRVADHAREREDAGETAVYVACDGSVVGVVSIRDEPRPAAADVVAALQDAGVRPVMLTGDNERTARSVAETVGIDDYRATLLPEEKQDAIQEFQREGHVIAMVGDGINDAPSLATADIGIAMGAAGTDTAIETADMALMADDLERIPYAVRLSRATRWNVSENVAVAVATVVLLLAGVFAGYVHMASGMLVHIASVLLVILNGMRLLRY